MEVYTVRIIATISLIGAALTLVFFVTVPEILSQETGVVSGGDAATFTVNTVVDTLDANPGDGVCADAAGACSLRAAIGEANAFAGADTIMMAAGTFTQTLVAPNDDVNAGGDWDISSVITMIGTGEASCSLQPAVSPGVATERVLDVRPGGDLRLSRVTVRNGNFSGTMTDATRGAGIENLGVLTLDSVTVRDNQITSNNGDPFGAGIYNAGTAMTLNSSAVHANAILRQTVGNVFGGGIASISETTITTTNSFIGNSAFANGGSVFGAGLYLENRFTVNMSGTVVAGSLAGSTGGTNGSGVSAISNAGAAVFNATGCSFRNNSASGSAGGQGVGLYFLTTSAGTNTLIANLDNVSVKENNGTPDGVGIGSAVNGGNMTLNISRSSITDNIGGVAGGGMFVTDAGNSTAAGHATVNLTNTTISGNTANGGGGGIALQGDRTGANLNFVTIAGNSAGGGGGILLAASGTVTIKNSIVGDNAGGTSPDISGPIVSGDYNNIENLAGATISGTTTHNANGDAQLGPLVEYVGATVHMPSLMSPVLNSIPSGINDCGTTIHTDQRVVVQRPQGGACDKGSVERVISASISGRVLTSGGLPIRNAAVTLYGLPQPVVTYTGSFGYYYFQDVPGEVGYTLRASTRRFEFPPFYSLSVYLIGDRSDLDFVADPNFMRASE